MTIKNTILQRKADAAREDREARVMSPRRALRRALARVAELGLSLPLSVTGAEEMEVDRDSLLGRIEDGGLMVTLERDAGPPGLVVLDLQLLTALIEVQTLGQVFARTAQARAVTRTDAAVAMPLIDGMLSGFDTLLNGDDRAAALTGFHFGQWARDRRILAAQLPDGGYSLFRLSVVIGTGDRIGAVTLALPCPVAVSSPPQHQTRPGSVREEVMEAPARLETILHRLEMTLDQIAGLSAGDVLTVPLRALSEVRLHTGDRQIVASGVLGQLGGHRAVRLTGFGQPRISGAAGQSVATVPRGDRMGELDLADAGLVAAPKPRQSNQGAQPAKAVPSPQVAAELPPRAPVREDPTGTEALLSELGLSDLETSAPGLPAPLQVSDRETGSFMDDIPKRSAARGDG
ncbi:flagellar motor switch protein FliM [Thalassovita litoralis]|jgi:flagellar motor switch protein FliM|uniref:Flagellar motor switch protein FliM n=1 Tax=Thalassovita litoralis TaxID=1010611 RepID=A0A521EN51_9RHOB|nr:FliM/FliN family flagellar motor C-terminal domain-containing protein [Thalassovita litoralis]SMO84881.1 flagellar motor switch protein FliM [Thalassovita litoralis]